MPFIDETQKKAIHDALETMRVRSGVDPSNPIWKGLLNTFKQILDTVNNPFYFDADQCRSWYDLRTEKASLKVAVTDVDLNQNTQVVLQAFLEGRRDNVLPAVLKIHDECFKDDRNTEDLLKEIDKQLNRLRKDLKDAMSAIPTIVPGATNSSLPEKSVILNVVELAQKIGLLEVDREAIIELGNMLHGKTINDLRSFIKNQPSAQLRPYTITSQFHWFESEFILLKNKQFYEAQEAYAKLISPAGSDKNKILACLEGYKRSKDSVFLADTAQRQMLDALVDDALKTPEMIDVMVRLRIQEACAALTPGGVSDNYLFMLLRNQQTRRERVEHTSAQKSINAGVDAFVDARLKTEPMIKEAARVQAKTEFQALIHGAEGAVLFKRLQDYQTGRSNDQTPIQREVNKLVKAELNRVEMRAIAFPLKVQAQYQTLIDGTEGATLFEKLKAAQQAVQSAAPLTAVEKAVNALVVENLSLMIIEAQKAAQFRLEEAKVSPILEPEHRYRAVTVAVVPLKQQEQERLVVEETARQAQEQQQREQARLAIEASAVQAEQERLQQEALQQEQDRLAIEEAARQAQEQRDEQARLAIVAASASVDPTASGEADFNVLNTAGTFTATDTADIGELKGRLAGLCGGLVEASTFATTLTPDNLRKQVLNGRLNTALDATATALVAAVRGMPTGTLDEHRARFEAAAELKSLEGIKDTARVRAISESGALETDTLGDWITAASRETGDEAQLRALKAIRNSAAAQGTTAWTSSTAVQDGIARYEDAAAQRFIRDAAAHGTAPVAELEAVQTDLRDNHNAVYLRHADPLSDALGLADYNALVTRLGTGTVEAELNARYAGLCNARDAVAPAGRTPRSKDELNRHIDTGLLALEAQLNAAVDTILARQGVDFTTLSALVLSDGTADEMRQEAAYNAARDSIIAACGGEPVAPANEVAQRALGHIQTGLNGLGNLRGHQVAIDLLSELQNTSPNPVILAQQVETVDKLKVVDSSLGGRLTTETAKQAFLPSLARAKTLASTAVVNTEILSKPQAQQDATPDQKKAALLAQKKGKR